MKFTITLTLAAAASAIHFTAATEEELTARLTAFNTAPLEMSQQGLYCTLQQMYEMLPEDDAEALEIEGAVLASVGEKRTVKEIMEEHFGLTIDKNGEELELAYEAIQACIAEGPSVFKDPTRPATSGPSARAASGPTDPKAAMIKQTFESYFKQAPLDMNEDGLLCTLHEMDRLSTHP